MRDADSDSHERPACMLRVPPLELRRLGCVARLLWRPDSVQDGSARRRETKRRVKGQNVCPESRIFTD